MKALILSTLLTTFAVTAAEKLVPEEFVVKPGAVRYWTFNASSGTRVWGRFRASGGSRNDIQAIVAEWAECENWMNGNQGSVLYASGTVTNGKVDVTIREAGQYCIAFNNKMSVISAKEVSAAIAIE